MSEIVGWALERWPFAVLMLLANGFLYGGLLFGWGPEVVRPVSAQTVQAQITVAKNDVLSQHGPMQQQLKDIKEKQDTMEKRQVTDELDRLEQQLLWWKQQNCKSKGKARSYTWQMMNKLKDRYRELQHTDWQEPTCGDIGE